MRTPAFETPGNYPHPIQRGILHCPCCPYRFSSTPCRPFFLPETYQIPPNMPYFRNAVNSYPRIYPTYQIRPTPEAKLEEPQQRPCVSEVVSVQPCKYLDQSVAVLRKPVELRAYRKRNDPLPAVKTKVRYYNPCSAPMMTSPGYAQLGYQIPTRLKEEAKRKPLRQIDETEEAEEDSNPFIVYKHRRIKKKYKKYMQKKGLKEDYLDEKSGSDDWEEGDKEEEPEGGGKEEEPDADSSLLVELKNETVL